ncbi:MAG: hypothetical protein Q9159_002801 [Coniocarpon cinnabarinum]
MADEVDHVSNDLADLDLSEKASDWTIDDLLNRSVPYKRRKVSPKDTLTSNFLTPLSTFSPEWLARLQCRFPISTPTTDLLALAPTQSRTVTRFTRSGLEGRVTGYNEVTVPAAAANAKNSTSMLRKAAGRAEFVRGGSGFMPFTPGGLEDIEQVAEVEGRVLEDERPSARRRGGKGLKRVVDVREGGLLTMAPGMPRGFMERKKKGEREQTVEGIVGEEVVEDVESTDDRINVNGTAVDGDAIEDGEDEGVHDDDIDALLPVEFPALAGKPNLKSSRQRPGKEWAHSIDVNKPFANFHELVPEMARTWPFELDTFQKEAVYHLESNESVFVAAHTSAGKTVVAEYAIALAQKHMTKAIYTSPIKALSNQKFRDFQGVFEDVGILTGDVQIRPEASCLIMTTEILRSMLYRGADLIRDVEYVIFDEVHYVNDLERGVVWEEVIIMLPEHVTLILLSATVPNTYEFASWVGRTKKKDIYVISTPKRPVPLQHYLWAGKGMHLIVDSEKKFVEKGWKEANDVLSGRDKIKAAEAKQAAQNQGGRGQAQNQRGQRGSGQRGSQQQQRGRGQPATRGQGNIARTGRGGGRTTAAQDRTLWVGLVNHLRKEDLLPTCIFVFSKKRCEENADAMSNLDFCDAKEKSAIHMILEKSLARLSQEDRKLPQIRRLREMLSRGIAVHHGGLLPIVKEVVEILFARTLVKVLFATETFAMGLNLPTRTVVFSGYRKHDGRQFRDLLPGEYTQMAGRAGRRGLDPVGSVIIVAPGAEEAPPAATLRNTMLGDPTKLRSQFRLTYNMILNLLRVEALKIEEMIKRSFSENAAQALLPEHEKAVKLSEADLDKIKREPCNICDKDIEECHQASMDYRRLTSDLHLALLSSPIGRRMFMPRRAVVYQKDNVRMAGVLLREGITHIAAPSVQVLELAHNEASRSSSDILPYISSFRHFFSPLPRKRSELRLRAASIPLTDLEAITTTSIKTDPTLLLNLDRDPPQAAMDELLALASSWTDSAWDEVDLSKIKDLAIRELFNARSSASRAAEFATCLTCPDFLKHFTQRHDEWLIRENIHTLKQLMSDQNLQLLPDYEQRVAVLRDLGFVDDDARVELKGKVACEIHGADELVLTELILENVLADFEPPEICALLSCFVFQEKTDVEPTLTPALERGKDIVVKISEKVNHYQTVHQVILAADDSNDFVSRPRFGLMEVVHEWARGMSFAAITDLTDVLEGTIVRVIGRLEETCREVRNAARIVGDPVLFQKMEACGECVRRDIMAVASLYM